MNLREAGITEIGFDYQNGIEDCALFKFASKIVKQRQDENTFLKEGKDGKVLFNYIDEEDKGRILEIGLNNEGKQILIFQTKNISGRMEKVDQYTVFGISDERAEECLLRAMKINQHGIDDQRSIEGRSTMRQDVFLTAYINCF